MENKAQIKALERQRLKAGRMLLKGKSQAEVARQIGVARSTVCGWHAKVREGGLDALRSTGLRGRPASLSDSDVTALKKVLVSGEYKKYKHPISRFPSVFRAAATLRLTPAAARSGLKPVRNRSDSALPSAIELRNLSIFPASAYSGTSDAGPRPGEARLEAGFRSIQ